jgi:hypothetical protein
MDNIARLLGQVMVVPPPFAQIYRPTARTHSRLKRLGRFANDLQALIIARETANEASNQAARFLCQVVDVSIMFFGRICIELVQDPSLEISRLMAIITAKLVRDENFRLGRNRAWQSETMIPTMPLR